MANVFYLRIRGKSQGPYTLDQVRGLSSRGQLSRLHEVSTDGATWGRASAYPELFASTAAIAAEFVRPAPAVEPPRVPNAPPFTSAPQVFQAQPTMHQAPPQFVLQPQQQVVVHNTIVQHTHGPPAKSAFLAGILALFFGPLGMLYSTVPGAICLFLVNLVFGIPTFGLILFITWPLGIVWAIVAAGNSS